MKNIIFCFSGTGNTLKVALDLAAALDDCKAVQINDALLNGGFNIDWNGVERVGICCPVYSWGPPEIVVRLIRQLPHNVDGYFFTALTCGGSPGGTNAILQKLLRTRGIELQAGFVYRMPTNYIAVSGAISEERQQKMFSAMEEKHKKVIPLIQHKQKAPVENSFILLRPVTGVIYRLARRMFPRLDRQFSSDEKCNSCGVCVQLCPVNNITLEQEQTFWNGNCQQCFACIQWCPQQAVQFGNKTGERKRYHHPDINLQQMLSGGAKQ